MSKTFEEYAVLEIVPKVQGYSCTYMRRYCVNVFDILEGNASIKADRSKMMKLASGSVSRGVT
jgi:hypothetical protein